MHRHNVFQPHGAHGDSFILLFLTVYCMFSFIIIFFKRPQMANCSVCAGRRHQLRWFKKTTSLPPNTPGAAFLSLSPRRLKSMRQNAERRGEDMGFGIPLLLPVHAPEWNSSTEFHLFCSSGAQAMAPKTHCRNSGLCDTMFQPPSLKTHHGEHNDKNNCFIFIQRGLWLCWKAVDKHLSHGYPSLRSGG